VVGGLFVFVAIAVPLPGFDFVIRPPLWASYLFLFVICLAAIVMGAASATGMLMYKVVLRTDAIEVSGAFRRRSLKKNDISAKDIYSIGCPTYVLYPRDKKQRLLQVGVVFAEDERFRDWRPIFQSASHNKGNH